MDAPNIAVVEVPDNRFHCLGQFAAPGMPKTDLKIIEILKRDLKEWIGSGCENGLGCTGRGGKSYPWFGNGCPGFFL